MKKTITILVPTDFSSASRAGMRFAIQWTRQQKAKLVFVHVLRLLRLPVWSEKQYQVYAAKERLLHSRQLVRLASEVCRQMKVPSKEYTTQLLEGISPDITLTELTKHHPDIDLICMATSGAGKFKKLFGTNTGNLILRSEIPVIAVPVAYRVKLIKRILYATDLADYSSELGKVVNITRSLHAEIIVVHFNETGEVRLNPSLVNKVWEKQYGYPVKLRYESADPDLSLVENLQGVISRLNPSLVVMFTDRRRTLYQRLLNPSQSESLSFQLKVPLLVFGKMQ
jgi:nucleotide-binding universal stress UspA family protein